MNPFWKISGDQGSQLQVELVGPVATDEGYRWVPAVVTLSVGGFNAKVQMTLTADDIERFGEQLETTYKSLSGIAEFSTIEGQLTLEIEMNRQGHVKVSGRLGDDASFPNTLTFTFNSDQTFLPKTISELSAVRKELSGKAT